MKKKTAALLSSCAAIAVCSSLIVGSTYALFTSEDKVNIAVTSGKVSVKAEILDETLVLTSMGEALEGNTWENGGTAGFSSEDVLNLTNITPGDGVSFEIKVKNESTVNIQYKISWSVEGALKNVLEANATGAKFNEWTEWTAPATENEKVKTVSVSVELPSYVGNLYQDETASINFSVEAVQGNGAVSDNVNVSVWDGETTDTTWYNAESAEYTITSANQLAGFAKLTNEGNTFSGKTVKLGADIDLANHEWTPIKDFNGVSFNGGNHTISNLKVVGKDALGLFGGFVNCKSINNTRIVNAYVEGTNYVGALVGKAGHINELNNNYVENATIICVPYVKTQSPLLYDGGAKAGVLAGYAVSAGSLPTNVSGNVIKNSTVYAYRDLGGLIGCAGADNGHDYNVYNNTVANVTVGYISIDKYQPYDGNNVNEYIGEIVGRESTHPEKFSYYDNATANVTLAGGVKYVASQETFVEAITSLEDGETLLLAEGTYTSTALEQLKITADNVTIKGAGEATVIDCGAYSVSGQAGLFIGGNNVTISDLTVKSSAGGGISAIKASNYNFGEVNTKNIVIENVTVESLGHGINLHGVEGAIINNVNVKSYGKCGISVARATDVVITNCTTVAGGWADIGCMYGNGSYETPSNITIGEGNVFGNGFVYSERPVTANEGADKVSYPEGWTLTVAENGTWMLTK